MSKRNLDRTQIAILISLGGGILHGYEIMKFVQEVGSITIGATTLYRKIHGLDKDGLIEEVSAPAHETDPRKRYYQLTGLGEQIAKIELRQLDKLMQVAEQKPVFSARLVLKGA